MIRKNHPGVETNSPSCKTTFLTDKKKKYVSLNFISFRLFNKLNKILKLLMNFNTQRSC